RVAAGVGIVCYFIPRPVFCGQVAFEQVAVDSIDAVFPAQQGLQLLAQAAVRHGNSLTALAIQLRFLRIGVAPLGILERPKESLTHRLEGAETSALVRDAVPILGTVETKHGARSRPAGAAKVHAGNDRGPGVDIRRQQPRVTSQSAEEGTFAGLDLA